MTEKLKQYPVTEVQRLVGVHYGEAQHEFYTEHRDKD